MKASTIFFLSLFLFVNFVNAQNKNNREKAAEFYNQALVLQEKGDELNALVNYDKAIALDANLAVAYNNRANIKVGKGDLAGAIADLSKVVEINPKQPLSYYNRGNIYLQQENHAAAIADFTKAIEILEGYTQDYDLIAHAMSYNNRGNCLQAKGDLKAALADYNKSIEIAPKNYEAYTNRGAVKHALKDYRGAVEDYSKSLIIFKNNPLIYVNRGNSYEEIDKTAAIADYTQAIALDATQAIAYARRALVLLDLKRKSEAVKDFEKAFELDPNLKPVYQDFLKSAKAR